MALVAPVTAVCAVVIPVAVSLVQGERLGPITLAGIGLALVSVVLVGQQRGGPRGPMAVRALAPGIGLALASGVAIGVFFLLLARTSPAAGLWPLVGARSVSLAFFGALAACRHRSLRLPRVVAVLAVSGGAIDMLANAAYLLATRYADLSVVVTLSSLYPASTVLLARIVLGERLSLWQTTGVGCALAAVVLIVGGG
jgi:drug/metabolite transporter (DMT)-like permease